MYKEDSVLNNLQGFICHKIQSNNQSEILTKNKLLARLEFAFLLFSLKADQILSINLSIRKN